MNMRFVVLLFIVVISFSTYSQDYKISVVNLEKKADINEKNYFDNFYSMPNIVERMGIDKIRQLNERLQIFSPHSLNTFSRQSIDNHYLKSFNLKRLKSSDMCINLSELKHWNCYPSYEQYLEIMQEFANKYPYLCRLVEFGQSVKGRRLLAVEISDNVKKKEAEPATFYSSTMHGDETTGYVLMLRLIDYLLANYGKDERVTNLVNNTEIWINPMANPDGTYSGGNHTVFDAVRTNGKNFDLNRNFPDITDTSAAINVQTENVAMIKFMKNHNFVLSANFHGGQEVVNYPWDSWFAPHLHADNEWYRTICRQYVDTVHANSPQGYMNYQENGITLGSDWYRIKNGRQDYVNYYLHGREITIELSKLKTPNADMLPQYWNYNFRSLLNYIANVNKGIRGRITNENGEPLRAKLTILGHDKDSSSVYSDGVTGWYYRMLNKGNYKFQITCNGYKDTTFTANLLNGEQKQVDIVLKKMKTNVHEVENEYLSSLTYNNPVTDYLNIRFLAKKSDIASLKIYNIGGSEIISNEYNILKGDNLIQLNFAKFKKGYYICKIQGAFISASFAVVRK